MRKFLSGGLVIMAGVVCSPSPVSPIQIHKAPHSDLQQDSRFHKIREFFNRMDCPAEQYSAVFVEAADDYNLDWRLLPSLSFVESTGGKAAPNNNLFGWDSGRASFPSPIASIHTVGYQLTHSPAYRHKNLDQVLATYNPVGDYPQKVKAVMRQISPHQ
jgi:hypothetical protein